MFCKFSQSKTFDFDPMGNVSKITIFQYFIADILVRYRGTGLHKVVSFDVLCHLSTYLVWDSVCGPSYKVSNISLEI